MHRRTISPPATVAFSKMGFLEKVSLAAPCNFGFTFPLIPPRRRRSTCPRRSPTDAGDLPHLPGKVGRALKRVHTPNTKMVSSFYVAHKHFFSNWTSFFTIRTRRRIFRTLLRVNFNRYRSIILVRDRPCVTKQIFKSRMGGVGICSQDLPCHRNYVQSAPGFPGSFLLLGYRPRVLFCISTFGAHERELRAQGRLLVSADGCVTTM